MLHYQEILSITVLKFHRVVAEVAGLADSSLCAPPLASSPGGTGLTAGLDPGCGGTDAAGVGWGKETGLVGGGKPGSLLMMGWP